MSTLAVHHSVVLCEGLLTPRQRLFCARIAAGASGAEAARQAGYSANAATQQASRLLNQAKVRQEVDRIVADQQRLQQAALDRMLSKVETVYSHAIRQRQCAAALKAIEMEAVLRQSGARSLPQAVSPADLQGEADAASDDDIQP